MDLTEIVHFDNLQRHPWELARYQIVREHISGLISAFSRTQLTILDIGCGDAFLVHRLSQDFPELHFIGVDINFSDALLNQIRNNILTNNLEIYKSLDELGASREVDLILLLDVIEHIEDEISFLDSLKRYSFIGPETPFLITVPAYQSLFATHDTILGHFRRYTNQSLRSRLKMAGYHTSFERYFFFTLLAPRFLQLIGEKIIRNKQKHSSDLAAWKGSRFMTSIIERILLIDYHTGSLLKRIGIKLPGLSNLVICRRSA